MLAERARRLDPAGGWGDISVVITGHAGIRAVNRVHLGHDEVTDVISFRYDPVPGEADACDGEILVNAERAVERAAQAGRWSASRELALYIAHGMDHLAGADDATPAERMRMRRRELRWLRAAGEVVERLLGSGR